MMESGSNVPSHPTAPDADRDQLLADLYYYRAILRQAGGDEMAIYLIEMTIAELSPHSRVCGPS